MNSIGILGYISSGRNMKSLTGLNSLRLVENQTDKIIKVLRIDNGGAFCRNGFE
jgi:hypothetical protein